MNENPEADLKAEGTKGKGSDVVIQYSPYDTEGGTDVNGDNQRPTAVAPGHELKHGQNMMTG